jgi:prepilin-type N-terminal cleavage/methylation domain-containing protein
LTTSNISKPLSNKAFSLIELSLVILIIGILIAGTIQGGKLINKAKLDSARLLTENSPVSGIENLVSWWESTSEKSFIDSETEDSESVTTWYDINPQSIHKFNAIQSTPANKPTYNSKGINNLPALHFNGSSSYFEIPFSQNLNPSTLTIFVVMTLSSVSNYGSVISSRNIVSGKFGGYVIYANPLYKHYEFWSGNGTSTWQTTGTIPTTLKTPITLSFTQSSNTINIYKNGSIVDSQSKTMLINNNRLLRILEKA